MNYIFCDIDGVLTTGYKFYDNTGLGVYKEFYDKDFTALKQLTSIGFKIVFITGDENINRRVFENRNYQVFSSRDHDKAEIIKRNFKFDKGDNIFSIGDDIFDLSMLKLSDIPICPNNAHYEILNYCKNHQFGIVTKSNAGNGVILDFLEIYSNQHDIKLDLNKIYQLDRKEKF